MLMLFPAALALFPAGTTASHPTDTKKNARPALVKLIVHADKYDYDEAPVTAYVPLPDNATVGRLLLDGKPVVSQQNAENGKLAVTWLVQHLKKGETRAYTLDFTTRRPRTLTTEPNVFLKQEGNNLDVLVHKELFTRYDATTGPNKPYFYPLLAPGGKRLVRGYPVEKISGEVTTDHPHHRGLWFTHSDVNGEDYWLEKGVTGKTVHTGYRGIVSGAIFGEFHTGTDWINAAGKRIAQDERTFRIYDLTAGRVLDVEITIKATDGAITFGDNKDGVLGIRVPDSMRVLIENKQRGAGHILSSTGEKDADAWGKRADWVDYYGPVEGETLGIAIFDHPQNFRHPTYWHVRDYGLFAANPFGIHDFVKGEPKGAGSFTLPAGKSQTFRYRLFFHKGTTDTAHVAEVWNAYANPPAVSIE